VPRKRLRQDGRLVACLVMCFVFIFSLNITTMRQDGGGGSSSSSSGSSSSSSIVVVVVVLVVVVIANHDHKIMVCN
jgi:uncharacterized membrane protein